MVLEIESAAQSPEKPNGCRMWTEIGGALAFRTVRALRRSKRESADSRKEVYANPTPLFWLDPAVF
jgi:hypothetical protein